MQDENYLLTAVDKLTQKHLTRVLQARTVELRDKEGEITKSMDVRCVSVVDHEPLLLQLRTAVLSSTGSKGAGSDGAARLPFNALAQAMFDEMSKQINAWYLALPNAREERRIHDRLRDWYVDFENRRRAGKLKSLEEDDTTTLVEGWVRSIEAMFDPPVILEITEDELGEQPRAAACPVCGGRYAIDPASGDRVTALVIEYRNLGASTIEQSTGLCRSCESVWRGSSGLRAMRWDIDNPPETEFVTLEGLTVHQIRKGVQLALVVRNMRAVAKLIDLLAMVDEQAAAVERLAVKVAVQADKESAARREAARREEIRKEREQRNRQVTAERRSS